ncbi:MAG: archaeal proteasome endopeptidase complex subunit beta [Candidatus Altiarchaeota archaeon]|nr:archaeal proteasome endopeptidase complex subunit beta [Candidatus Altiarchaeota archaeon]
MSENHQKTGTTTVALKCKDGVILATDKRATMGSFISNKEVNKIYQIDDRIAATVAGGVGDAQNMMRIIRAESKLYKMNRRETVPVKGVATLLANILNNNRYYPYLVMSIVAGMDKSPRVYSVDPVGGLVEEDYIATGSGSPMAYGLLESEFKKDKAVQENLPVAVKSVKVAMERDSGSGNGINLATITEKEGFRLYGEDEVQRLLSSL